MSTDIDIDLSSLIDIDLTPPCEYTEHNIWSKSDQPAEFVVIHFQCCEYIKAKRLFCTPCKNHRVSFDFFTCRGCRTHFEGTEGIIAVIPI